MRFKIDKSQWERIGKKSGWLKESAVTDKVSDQLSNIFSPGTRKIRPDVLETIRNGVSMIEEYLSKNHPEVKVMHPLIIIGAAVTYQYGPGSDIDTTVYLNLPNEEDPKFREIDKWVGANVDTKFVLNEGDSSRPYQFKCKSESTRGDLENADAVVSAETGEFIKEPPHPNYVSIIRDDNIRNIGSPQGQYGEIEKKALGGIRNFTAIANELIANGMNINNPRLMSIANMIVQIYESLGTTRREGYSKPIEGLPSRNWNPANFVYKMFDREGYIEIMKYLKGAIKDGKLDESELALILKSIEEKRIMSQQPGFSGV